MKSVNILCGLALLVAVCVYANCPNACSGHGACGADDMCSCDRNFVGADCSQRVCPFATSHMTTGQGDLNMDGDTLDNSMKKIPATGTVAVTYLSAGITFSADPTASSYTTLTVGDGVIINGQKHTLATKTSATVWVLDRVFMGSTDSTATAFKFVQTQANPEGDWEGWAGDYVANSDEGHFYMECANRGICDRKAGACKCFPGYDGAACERTVCPNDCSGHGTCEKVSELRVQEPQAVNCQVLAGVQGENSFTTMSDCSSVISNGDTIWIGTSSKPLQVKASSGVSATAVSLAETVTNLLPEPVAPGTSIRVQRAYNLWDADVNRACKCDARYQGYDCSERKCPYGDDPLTVDQIFETQVVHIGGMDPLDKVTGSFRLVFEDMYGEKWTTAAVPVDGDADNKAALATALTALPNDIIQGVTVTHQSVKTAASGNAGNGVRYKVKFNGGTVSTATGNSGDLPNMHCDNSGLVRRLEGAFVTPFTYSAANGKFILTHGSAVPAGSVANGDIIAAYDAVPTFVADVTVTAVGVDTIYMSAATASATQFKVVRKIAGASCTVSDIAMMMPTPSAGIWVQAKATANTKQFTIRKGASGSEADSAVDADDLAVGDRVMLKSSSASQILTVTNINSATVDVKETITATYADQSSIFFYGRGSTEKSVCSGRGMCDSASGVCKCFKGYYLDDCSKQHALSG